MKTNILLIANFSDLLSCDASLLSASLYVNPDFGKVGPRPSESGRMDSLIFCTRKNLYITQCALWHAHSYSKFPEHHFFPDFFLKWTRLISTSFVKPRYNISIWLWLLTYKCEQWFIWQSFSDAWKKNKVSIRREVWLELGRWWKCK